MFDLTTAQQEVGDTLECTVTSAMAVQCTVNHCYSYSYSYCSFTFSWLLFKHSLLETYCFVKNLLCGSSIGGHLGQAGSQTGTQSA